MSNTCLLKFFEKPYFSVTAKTKVKGNASVHVDIFSNCIKQQGNSRTNREPLPTHTPTHTHMMLEEHSE